MAWLVFVDAASRQAYPLAIEKEKGGLVARFRVRDIGELRQRMKTSQREVVVVPYTVRTLADRLGVNRSTIGYLVSGKRPVVNEAVAIGVAEALGARVGELFVPEDSLSREGESGAGESPS